MVDASLTIPAQAEGATIIQMFTKLDQVFFSLKENMRGNHFAKRVAKFLHDRVNKIVCSNAGWQTCLYLHPQSRTHLELIAGGTQSYMVSMDQAQNILKQAPNNCRLLGERLHKIALRANLSPEEAAAEEDEIRAANDDANAAVEDSADDDTDTDSPATTTGKDI